MYQIILEDSTTSATLPLLNVPLQETVVEGATDVTTLDMNMYTDFFAKKRLWTHSWAYLSEADFNTIKGFYDRQFTLFEYPVVTISNLGVTEVVVRMNISPRSIVNNCGSVEDVEITLRETVQMTPEWGSS